MNSRPDAMGVAHRRAPDARIISLVPSLTELLVTLGLGDQLVGRTRYCVHPEGLTAPIVGGTKKVHMDRIEAADATHVVLNIDENTREMAEALRARVPNLIVTHPMGPDDNPALYGLMGEVFGREAEAAALTANFLAARRALTEVLEGVTRRRVVYLIWRAPWMAVSADTYVARTLALAGLDVVALDDPRRYPEVELSDALLSRVELVLLSTEPYPFDEPHRDALIASRPAYTGRVMLIDGEMTSWYGSRAVQAMGYLTRWIESLNAG